MLLSDLKTINIFKNCEQTLLEKIEKNLKIKDEKSGTTILNQGDETKNLYIIIDGTLLITQLAEDGKVVSLELLKKGQCFGEIAIIDGAPRSASVTSLSDVKLGSLSESLKDVETGAITLGSKGSIVFKGYNSFSIDPITVTKLVDTTGAGDIYASGFLFGLANNKSIKECGDIGNKAAAEIITHYGARPKISLKKILK